MGEVVVSIDPGERSGWAAWYMDLDHLELLESGVLRSDHMANWLAVQQGVTGPSLPEKLRRAGIKRGRRFGIIVNESWRPRRKNGSMDWIEGNPLLSVQHVGQIRLIADLSGARYVEQPPANKDIYRASMPLSLRSLDESSNEQHDQDARLHGWGYFKDNWFSAGVDPEEVIK